jgi:hypothetical protein
MGPFSPPPRPLRSVRGFAMVAVVALGINACAEIIWVLASARLDPAFARVAEEDEPLRTGDLLLALMVFAQPLTFALAGISFMAWLYRVRANAESFSEVPHRWFRIFIVLGWALPVINWWIPKQIVDDVWVSSRPGQVRGELIGREMHSWLVWGWWVSWLIGFWLLPMAAGLLVVTKGLDPVDIGLRIDAYVLVPSLIAAALASTVILRITRFQEDRHRLEQVWISEGSWT